MTKTYTIRAWCERPFIAAFDIEADAPEDAITETPVAMNSRQRARTASSRSAFSTRMPGCKEPHLRCWQHSLIFLSNLTQSGYPTGTEQRACRWIRLAPPSPEPPA